MSSASRLLPLVLLVAFGAGCPVGGLRTGRPIASLDVGQVAPSRTTKAQLFWLLGAPSVIAGPGEWVEAPSPSVRASVGGGVPSTFLYGGSYPVQGDALMELFPDRSDRSDLRVYHWTSMRERGWFFLFVVFFGVEQYSYAVDDLYVLVNERTERVEGVVFRPATDGSE